METRCTRVIDSQNPEAEKMAEIINNARKKAASHEIG